MSGMPFAPDCLRLRVRMVDGENEVLYRMRGGAITFLGGSSYYEPVN